MTYCSREEVACTRYASRESGTAWTGTSFTHGLDPDVKIGRTTMVRSLTRQRYRQENNMSNEQRALYAKLVRESVQNEDCMVEVYGNDIPIAEELVKLDMLLRHWEVRDGVVLFSVRYE